MQNGKFSAGTDILHIMLNVVDLPTFGSPTSPAFTLLPGRPRSARGFSSSFFLGGMFALAQNCASSEQRCSRRAERIHFIWLFA